MHYSVLKKEVISALNIKEDGIYVDATVGYAGHSSEILKRIKKGTLFAFDADNTALDYSHQLLTKIGTNFHLFHSNFKDMDKYLEEQHVLEVDGYLFDLGVSSPQIDDATRGFSFMKDGILDMRMNEDAKLTAKQIVNTYSKKDLETIFFKYGEEKKAKIIASKIVDVRQNKEIIRTLELVEIIKMAVGASYFYKEHPERLIFQALRIEVNQELKALEEALPKAIKRLKKGGRICVITFHSIEDSLVKNIFKQYSEVNEIFKGMPSIPQEYQPLIKIINKKPILPSLEELNENSRSKSAKLRVIERI